MKKLSVLNGRVSVNWATALLLAGSLAACTSTMPAQNFGADTQATGVLAAQHQSEGIKVSAVGYGALPTNESFSAAQKKLMARRASKLDAFRALAEEVQGVKINGTTTISSMVAQTDGFRVFVEAYLRGAQVVSVVAMPDGNYETTMELTLDQNFMDHFTSNQSAASSGGNNTLLGYAKVNPTKNFYYSE